MQNGSTLHLGEKIRQIRKAKGLSQENLAYAARCNVSTISRIESGQVEFAAEMLVEIKNYMGIKNAPLLEYELKRYRDRLLIWHELLDSHRIAEAKTMQSELSAITDLPFERDLFLLFTLLEARLLLIESNFSAAEEKINMAEALSYDASNEALHIFHYNKGMINFAHEDYKIALKYWLQSLNTIVSSGFKLNASLLHNIGAAYLLNCNFHEAIKFFDRAQAEFHGDRTRVIIPRITSAKANCYIFLKQYSKAMSLFDTALSQTESINSAIDIVSILSSIGALHIAMGAYEQGVDFCNQTLTYASHMNVSYDIRLIIYNKGLGLLKLKDFNQCKEVIEYGRSLSKGNELFLICFNTLEHLMTLNDKASINYIEDIVIPYMATNPRLKFLAFYICEELEHHYNKKRAKTKALSMAAIARDILKEVSLGETNLEQS